MWTLLAFTVFAHLQLSTAVKIFVNNPWDLVEGDTVTIPCTVTHTASQTPAVTFLKRTARQDIIMKDDGRIKITTTANATTTVAKLTINGAIESDETRDGYLCRATGAPGDKGFHIYVLAKKSVQKVTLQNTTNAEIGKPWSVKCVAESLKSSKITIINLSAKWYFSKSTPSKDNPGDELKNGTDIEVTAISSAITDGGRIESQLKIKSVSADNGGYYTCKVGLKVPNSIEHDVSKSTSILIAMSRDMSAKEKVKVKKGQDAELKCKVYGFPPGEVIWSKGGSVIDAKSDKRISFSDYNKVKNAVLKISETTFDDRAMYTCNATNGASSITVEFTLRVKDPLGPLWPFVGIVIEAILLVLIIFISEKYRASVKNKAAVSKGPANPESATLLEGKDPTIA